MSRRLAIIGSGDLGRQVAHHASLNKFEVVGYFDDFNDVSNDQYPILGKVSEIVDQFAENSFDKLFIAIGYKHMKVRKQLFNQFYKSIPFANIIHDSAIIDPSVEIGEGNIIYPGVAIDSNSIIHNNVLINIGSTIAHDAVIYSHSFLSSKIALAGFTIVNEQCILGINCTIIDNVEIASNTQIGAGSVVLKNVREEGVYVGNPIKKIR